MRGFVPSPPTMFKRTWCGAYALAVINGMSCDEAVVAVKRSLRRRRQVQGMYESEVEKVSRGKYFRQRLKFEELKKRVTLRSVGDLLKPKRFYMVVAGNHFVVVDTSDMRVCDTLSKAWVPLDIHPCRLWMVRAVAEGPRLVM